MSGTVVLRYHHPYPWMRYIYSYIYIYIHTHTWLVVWNSNSWLHLGLVESPMTDPHFWTILQTLRMVRACGIEEVVVSALLQQISCITDIAPNGISATLMTRIQTLGWHVTGDGKLRGDDTQNGQNGGLEHVSIYWEQLSQLTFILFKGVETTNQILYKLNQQ